MRQICLVTFAITIIFFTNENGNSIAQSTDTPTPRLTETPIASATAIEITSTITTTAPAPFLIFSTPPPVREEEALSSGFAQIPSVFEGVTDYHPIEAEMTSTDLAFSSASNVREAVFSVVQILHCGDEFGYTTPSGMNTRYHCDNRGARSTFSVA